jgi:hypothetical protein
MRRRSFRKPVVNVAMFPFLAVLVCTMGALIVLLVLMVQQARVYATTITLAPEDEPPISAADDDAPLIEDLRMEEERQLWRREILEEQRQEMTKKLADHRLQLSHLEDHIRQLEDRFQQLEAIAKQLASLRLNADADQLATLAEGQHVAEELDRVRLELERARKEAAERLRSFAVVPYDGPNGTRRRPIYIECTERGIILQPEGVRLESSDFDGPLGPGNPLDAALRAVREHLDRLGLEEGEPYPLLIVRPDGSLAYNVARAAMNAWDDEFGYELIDADLQLEYPPPDPALKDLLIATIGDARQRQAILAAAMPSQFQGEKLDGFVATQRGGFVPLGGPGSSGGRGIGAGSSSFGATSGRRGDHDRQQMGAANMGKVATSATDMGAVKTGAVKTGTAAGNHDGGRDDADAAQGAVSGGAAGSPQAGGASTSLAQSRGKNWGLPEASGSATPVTRPIGVAIYRDRLAILPENGVRAHPRIFPMPDGPHALVDDFVAAIRDHKDEWGLALPGGYWKPVLQMYVTPGAESQFEQLQVLLDGSGFDMEKKVP